MISLESIIQSELDLGSSIINLPKGEFKESIIIDRPCSIIGNDTTLWHENNPVLLIRSKGVILKNLNLQLTSISGYESDYAILQLQPDTIIENVEIFGGVANTKKFYIPRSVHLGSFMCSVNNTFKLSMYLPEVCNVVLKSSNIEVSQSTVGTGYVDLILKVNPLDDGSKVYGEILLISKFIRRIFIDGIALKDAPKHNDTLVYSVDGVNKDIPSEVFAVSVQKVDIAPKKLETRVLNRGERCILRNSNLTMKLSYNGYNVDIDPYIFLTDVNNQTIYNEDMIFFGNSSSSNQAVTIDKLNTITVNLERVPQYVQKICVCYAVYNSKHKSFKTFAMVKNFKFSIYVDGFELFKMFADNIGKSSTLVLLELYRYNGLWKVNPIISEYIGNLPQMCKSFGIDADY